MGAHHRGDEVATYVLSAIPECISFILRWILAQRSAGGHWHEGRSGLDWMGLNGFFVYYLCIDHPSHLGVSSIYS